MDERHSCSVRSKTFYISFGEINYHDRGTMVGNECAHKTQMKSREIEEDQEGMLWANWLPVIKIIHLD